MSGLPKNVLRLPGSRKRSVSSFMESPRKPGGQPKFRNLSGHSAAFCRIGKWGDKRSLPYPIVPAVGSDARQVNRGCVGPSEVSGGSLRRTGQSAAIRARARSCVSWCRCGKIGAAGPRPRAKTDPIPTGATLSIILVQRGNNVRAPQKRISVTGKQEKVSRNQ